jgi:16S rRNA A1518/A1519 N6-dimethyltransferase RsmA/KsgA/DIM1 with predicted DNA glycosylase/AP lyase activity
VLSPQGGAVRVLEVGAGDGRLAYFLVEALGHPVAAENGNGHAANGALSAELDG